jgi:hypothetical protein
MSNYYSVASKLPTLNLCINKNRVKCYQPTSPDSKLPIYYLDNGTEFQLEIYNPTPNTILAKILLNNNSISQNGLILQPGQRIYLDRYLDIPKKFLFETYEVDNNQEIKDIIKNNGNIKIEFYNEMVNTYNQSLSLPIYRRPATYPLYPVIPTYPTYPNYPPYILYGTNTSNVTLGNNYPITATSYYVNSNPNDIPLNGTLTSGSYTFTNSSNSETINLTSSKQNLKNDFTSKESNNKTMETGRIGNGSVSNQKFETRYYNFQLTSFHSIELKILPTSTKPNTINDVLIKKYCKNCGSKLGKTDKFCCQCGTKI